MSAVWRAKAASAAGRRTDLEGGVCTHSRPRLLLRGASTAPRARQRVTPYPALTRAMGAWSLRGDARGACERQQQPRGRQGRTISLARGTEGSPRATARRGPTPPERVAPLSVTASRAVRQAPRWRPVLRSGRPMSFPFANGRCKAEAFVCPPRRACAARGGPTHASAGCMYFYIARRPRRVARRCMVRAGRCRGAACNSSLPLARALGGRFPRPAPRLAVRFTFKRSLGD